MTADIIQTFLSLIVGLSILFLASYVWVEFVMLCVDIVKDKKPAEGEQE